MVADENGLEVGAQLDDAGPVGTAVPQQHAAQKPEAADDLSQRLAALRK